MKLRSALLVAAALMPLVACSSASFRPRAVGQNHLAPTDVDLLLVEARAQFRAGNHALAAGSFRRILARAPDSIEAYNGMAAAYDRLGRFDLARRYYEEGLALAPQDPGLRTNYAAALRAHGMEREAALVDLPAPVEQAVAAAPADSIIAEPALTILLPEPGPPPDAVATASVEVAVPTAPAPTPVAAASVDIVLPPPPPPASNPAQASRAGPEIVPPRPAPVAARPARASVDIVLPPPAPAPAPALVTHDAPNVAPPRPAAAPIRTARASVDIVLPPPPPPRPSPPAPAPMSAPVTLPPPPAIERVPRLERNSLGEVALITRRDPARRQQQMAAATPREGIRLPIRQIRSTGREIVWELPEAPTPTPAAPQSARRVAIVELRVLNAVGRRGQAGRMGAHLRNLGWAEVSAGDAIRRRSRSYILASPAQEMAARRLAAQLPFRPWINMTGRGGPIRLVLGNDAVRFDERLLRGRRES